MTQEVAGTSWEKICADDDWLIYADWTAGRLSMTHHPSLTKSEVTTTKDCIESVTMYSVTRNHQLTADEDVEHWSHTHAQRAETLLLSNKKATGAHVNQ